MLNLRLLYILLDSASVRTYLAIVAGLGFGVLLDIIVFLQLSLLIGPWVTMAILTANSALGVAIMYRVVENRGAQLLGTIDNGTFVQDIFSQYVNTLIAAGFLIVPGLFNSIVGLVMLVPLVGTRVGHAISRLTGIDWREAYEYLRLDRMTRHTPES